MSQVLTDRSRAPQNIRRRFRLRQPNDVLRFGGRIPRWGPVKVRAYLDRLSSRITWPAASTIGALFNREGLTVKRKFAAPQSASSVPFAHCGAANDVWCIDFKGWFLTGDGTPCEPLTLCDAHSRYLLRCQVMGGPTRLMSGRCWMRRSASSGCPSLRSDNGPPFASRGAGGLSQLSVKVIKAGVLPERIAPGKPQQNGRLERLHLTLLKDTADPPARTLRQQLERFHAFQRLYNEERPHEALGNATPAEHYAASPRRFDGVLREPELRLADHVVRRVRHNGEIRWQGNTIYISEALIGEPIGLAEEENGDWSLVYGPIALGTLARGADRLRKPNRTRCGLVDNAKTRCPQGLQPLQQPQQTTERNENCVTYVAGPNCYPCPGCSSRSAGREGGEPQAHPNDVGEFIPHFAHTFPRNCSVFVLHLPPSLTESESHGAMAPRLT